MAIGGYSIQHHSLTAQPFSPEQERKRWYAYFLLTERGRRVLEEDRSRFCAALWREWSPGLEPGADEIREAVRAFDNPDFVDVVLHSYRHRFGHAESDPAYAAAETFLARRPHVRIPTIVLRSSQGSLASAGRGADDDERFDILIDSRVVDCGHHVPREAPRAVADAILGVVSCLRTSDAE